MAHGPLVVTDNASGRDDAVGGKEGAKHDTAPCRPRGDCTGPFPSSFAARRRADPSPRQRIRQSTSLVARRPGKASEASTRRILRVIRAEEGGAPPSDLSGRTRTCIRCAYAKHGYGKLNWVAPGDSPKSTCSLGTHGARDVLGADFRCVADGWSPHGMPTLPGPRSIIARIPIADCLGRRGGVARARKRRAYTRRRTDSCRAVERGIAFALHSKRGLFPWTHVGPGWAAVGIVREAPSTVASRPPPSAWGAPIAVRAGGRDL